jgi:hypothetical protein
MASYYYTNKLTEVTTPVRTVSSVSRNHRFSGNPFRPGLSQNIPFHIQIMMNSSFHARKMQPNGRSDVSYGAQHIWRSHSDMLGYNALSTGNYGHFGGVYYLHLQNSLQLQWSEKKWSGVTVKFLGTKVPCTLGWSYPEGTWWYCDYFIWCVSCSMVVLTCL